MDERPGFTINSFVPQTHILSVFTDLALFAAVDILTNRAE
jgi:hypothetical protein